MDRSLKESYQKCRRILNKRMPLFKDFKEVLEVLKIEPLFLLDRLEEYIKESRGIEVRKGFIKEEFDFYINPMGDDIYNNTYMMLLCSRLFYIALEMIEKKWIEPRIGIKKVKPTDTLKFLSVLYTIRSIDLKASYWRIFLEAIQLLNNSVLNQILEEFFHYASLRNQQETIFLPPLDLLTFFIRGDVSRFTAQKGLILESLKKALSEKYQIEMYHGIEILL